MYATHSLRVFAIIPGAVIPIIACTSLQTIKDTLEPATALTSLQSIPGAIINVSCRNYIIVYHTERIN